MWDNATIMMNWRERTLLRNMIQIMYMPRVTEIRMKFLLRTMRRGREPSVSDSSHGIGKSFSAGMVPDLRRDICGCFLDLGLCRNGNTVVCEFINYKEDL